MQLTWVVCDRLGNKLAWLTDRGPSKATIPLCGQRTASVTISTEHPAAFTATGWPLRRQLRGFLGDACVFTGPILTPVLDGVAGTIELNAVDASYYLQRAFLNAPAPATSPYVFQLLATDQSTIMSAIVNAAGPSAADITAGIPVLPVASGSLPATLLRDRSYEPGQNIWDAVVNLSEVIDGVDFELNPQDRSDGIMALLNTFPRQGSDKSATVKFFYGWGPDNCENFVWKPDGGLVVNRMTVQGQSEYGGAPPYYRSDQLASLQQLGILAGFAGRSDISDPTTVREHAQATPSTLAFPPDLFEVAPAVEGLGTLDANGVRRRVNPATGSQYGVPPVCGPSGAYWVGDTIFAGAQVAPALRVQLWGRVTQVELSDGESDNFEARVALTLAPELPNYLTT